MTLPGQPVAKPRPRLTANGIHNPAAYVRWEKGAARIIRAAAGKFRMERDTGWVRVELTAYYRRPSKRPAYCPVPIWRSGERFPAAVRPDIDNVAKAVVDAAQLARLFHDDGAVVSLACEKWICGDGDEPRVDVEIVAFQWG